MEGLAFGARVLKQNLSKLCSRIYQTYAPESLKLEDFAAFEKQASEIDKQSLGSWLLVKALHAARA